MNKTLLITINSILWMALGIACTLYGPLVMAFMGVPDVPSEDVMLYWFVASFVRMFGAALFGLGLLLWAVRGLFDDPQVKSETRRGVIFALLLSNILSFVVALTQLASIWETSGSWAGWLFTGIFLIFMGAYLFMLMRPNSR